MFHFTMKINTTLVSYIQGGPFKLSASGNTLTWTFVIRYSSGIPCSKHQFTRICVMGQYYKLYENRWITRDVNKKR